MTNQRHRQQRTWPNVLLAGAVCVSILSQPPAARAADPRDLIREGNAHYAAQCYTLAQASYEQALTAAGPHPPAELLHNLAAVHYRLARFDEAREYWNRARPLGDAAFEARAYYNLGNCDYAAALHKLAAQDRAAALTLLTHAAKQYHEAIRLDPTLSEARANLELISRLTAQIEQAPDPQSSPDEPGEPAQAGEQGGATTGAGTSEPSPDAQPADVPADPHSADPAQPAPQLQTSDSPDSDSDEGDSHAAPNADAPAEITDTNATPAPRPPTQMTRTQAERLLQLVREAERARREMLARRQSAREPPVQRDW